MNQIDWTKREINYPTVLVREFNLLPWKLLEYAKKENSVRIWNNTMNRFNLIDTVPTAEYTFIFQMHMEHKIACKGGP